MSRTSVSSRNLWYYFLPFMLSNAFYLSSAANYKVFALLGLPFALRAIRINVVLIGLVLYSIQTLLLARYSADFRDSMVYMTLTLAMAVGFFTWVSLWLRQPVRAPLWLYVVVPFLGQVIPNTILAVDPMLLCGLFFVGLLSKGRTRIPHNYAALIFIAAITASMMSGWRAAELALLSGFLAYIIQRHRSLVVQNTMLVGIGVLIVLAVYQYQEELVAFLISSGTAGDPSSGRIAMLAHVQNFLSENFRDGELGSFIGFGLNSYSQIYTTDVTAFFSLDGQEIISTKRIKAEGNSRLHAHNALIQVIVEFGIVGLGVYLWSVVKFWKTTRPMQFLVVMGLVGGQFSGVFYPYSQYYLMLLSFMWLKAYRRF